jgi:hypothetical protein
MSAIAAARSGLVEAMATGSAGGLNMDMLEQPASASARPETTEVAVKYGAERPFRGFILHITTRPFMAGNTDLCVLYFL